MPTVPFFYECEIPNSHRNIFIVKTQFLFVNLTDKLISKNFSGVKMDFHFRKINGTVGTYAIDCFFSMLQMAFVFEHKDDFLPFCYSLSDNTK